MTQAEWEDTGKPWTNYDQSVVRVITEEAPSRAAKHLWCRTAIFIEPPAQAREFGHRVKLNPDRKVA